MKWRAQAWHWGTLLAALSMGLVVPGCGEASDSLIITAISPPPGSVLDSPTQFSVTFDYVMQSKEKGYAPGTYEIDWVLTENGGHGGATLGDIAGPLDEALSGTVTVSFRPT